MLFVVLMMLSCEKESTSPIYLTVVPQESFIEASPLEIIRFEIQIKSDNQIQRLMIDTKTDLEGYTTILDSTINPTPSFNYLLDFTVPFDVDTSGLSIIFTGFDHQGNSNKVVRKILIDPQGVLLTESSGHSFYSSLSSQPNAFRLDIKTPVYASQVNDSLIDFLDATNMFIHGNDISREWDSPSGIKFVKFNDFNYPEATALTVSQSYINGLKLEKLSSISYNDIVLIGRNNTAIGVVLIVNVFDEDGTANDRYLFNLKLIN